VRLCCNCSMKKTAFGALPATLILVLIAYLCKGESERPRILRPLDESVVPAGPLEIALIVPRGAAPPSVMLDGQKLDISSHFSPPKEGASPSPASGLFLPPAVVIVCSLHPGLHELRAGDTTVRFFVRDEKGGNVPPAKWPHYTPHPPPPADAVTCTSCHKLNNQKRFVNMNTAFSLEKPSGCFDCHDRSEFNLTHKHRYETLAFCQMCHDPHGATSDHLLKMPADNACTLCHE